MTCCFFYRSVIVAAAAAVAAANILAVALVETKELSQSEPQ